MFVPILGGTILGVVCDKQFGTYPIAVIAGIVIGVIITGLLIWKQLKRIR
jgi:F0F1-type ATP synthase assembly protein I